MPCRPLNLFLQTELAFASLKYNMVFIIVQFPPQSSCIETSSKHSRQPLQVVQFVDYKVGQRLWWKKIVTETKAEKLRLLQA